MKREIRIYFEGNRKLRLGLGEFLSSIRNAASAKKLGWQLIASGSRTNTIKNFRVALRDHPEAFNILLVDAEEAVFHSSWDHLRGRNELNWPKQDDLADTHCHLMVQVMEAWFIADIEALRNYYGQGFNENAIPKDREVEKIGKDKIESALIGATRNTSKREYHKTHHAPKLLSKLSVERVRKAAPACERLFKVLNDWIDSEASKRGD